MTSIENVLDKIIPSADDQSPISVPKA